MKAFSKCKDGGPESPVDSYTIFEIKSLFSIMILKFNKGGRENYHTHAFNAYTWFLKGSLQEQDINGSTYDYKRSLIPKKTPRSKNHRVRAHTDSWCFTVRGPWVDYWTEDTPDNKVLTLTHGREVINERWGSTGPS